jgi:nitrile hydratase accessory protein
MTGDATNPLLDKCLPVDEGLTFAHPWEAKAFAIVVQLSSAGHFAWSEWVECFSGEVHAATALEANGQPAPSYYEQWLAAAEKIMIAKGVTSPDQLAARRFAVGVVGTTHRMPT